MLISAKTVTNQTGMIMKKQILGCTLGIALFGAVIAASAQSTFNYFISDAGGGNSLVTWNATGSLTESPGVEWAVSLGDFGGVPIETSGLLYLATLA